MKLSSLKVTVAPPAVPYYQVLVYQVKNSHPSSLFYFRTRAAAGMFTRDTLTLTVHQENRLSIGEEVSFRATPKPTPAAENKAQIPGGKRGVDAAPDTAWVLPDKTLPGWSSHRCYVQFRS